MDEVSIEGAEVVRKKFTGVSKKPIILLCVVGLVLAPIAVYDDNWLNANIDTDDFVGDHYETKRVHKSGHIPNGVLC